MLDEVFYNCGAYEIIMMLHELHNRGYEQLRLMSGMSPSGLYWRWMIYPKVIMKDNADVERKIKLVDFECPKGSVGTERSNNDFSKMADMLLDRYKSLFDVAKLQDKDYVEWYRGVVCHAQDNNFPIAFEDFFDAEEWKYLSGERLHFPPFTPADNTQIPDENIIEYALKYFDEFSIWQLEEVLKYKGIRPTAHEIANVIRKALNEGKGLVNHEDSALWQILEYRQDEIANKQESENGIILTLKNGDVINLKDTIELFAWSSESDK